MRQTLIGCFVAFHLVAITLMALPAPVGADRKSTWSNPTVRSELIRAHELSKVIGVEMSYPEFEASLFDLVVGSVELRRSLLRPFVPYYTLAGTSQSWRMFIAPHTHPARLQIHGLIDGVWVPLFERGGGEDWLARLLNGERTRSVLFRYSWAPYRGLYNQFSKAIQDRVMRQMPEVQAVRVRYLQYETPSAEQVVQAEAVKERPLLHRVRRRRE